MAFVRSRTAVCSKSEGSRRWRDFQEGVMTFEHSWVLLFALIPIGWGAYAWGRAAHRLGLILKVLTICAVIAAVAEPRIFVPETKVATAVLVDTSASVT